MSKRSKKRVQARPGAATMRIPHTALWSVLLLVVLLPLAAHFLYSQNGFNPTDEGFILAYSRRLLNGEIPHLHFVSIRPVGSPWLHSIELGFGDYTFWLSRLVTWFEIAVTAWAWMHIIARKLGLRLGLADQCVWVLTAFVLCAHLFPVMAWHTIDALFLTALGILIAVRLERAQWLGYLLVGMAYLCKQNFLLVAPASVLILGHWRAWRNWLAIALPGLVYVILVAAAGALPDALLQLTAQSDLKLYGVDRFWYYAELRVPLLLAFAAMFLLYFQWRGRVPSEWLVLQRIVGGLLLMKPIFDAAMGLASWDYFEIPSFALFGAAVGATLYFVLPNPSRTRALQAGSLAILVSWSAAVSIGYNTPALATGILAMVLLGYLYLAFQVPVTEWQKYLPLAASGVIALAALVQFHTAREQFVYRDRAVAQLTSPLNHVLRGTAQLVTNANTAAFLSDLQGAVAQTHGTRYTILPDLAAYWVQAPHANPLAMDWAQHIELSDPRLTAQVVAQLDRQRGSIIIIAQKVQAEQLARGFVPIAPGYSPVLDFVRNNYTRVGETEFFELYQ